MGKAELNWDVTAREVEVESPQADPTTGGIVLTTQGQQRGGTGTSKSAGFPQAATLGEVLPFLSCRKNSAGCAAGCRDIPHPLPLLGKDLALHPSLGVL